MSPHDLTALYDAHAELVWKHLHRLGVRSADVPDLLQEVFLVVHRRASELRAGAPVGPFLFGVAAGLASNYRRRAFRRLEVLGTDVEVADSERAEDPERALARSRQRRRIEDALDALEPDKRVVFVMFELEAMSGKDIAAALGVPVGTVHSRLHAARRELAATLAAESVDGGRTA